ncbi:hypothetical protein EG240_15980 [Paenimyroides tangerinum]|uniref:MobA/VirD2-like nuclease domain-containing protein n=1 Tax=Paenimyroides tangerinum TaxID=2488728 RepID=A0A3P3W1C2_9FLAO|nr:relaxase/mobilization nuclease domain-containing protein [Paenimyroides tangerinum]RRJ86673.1 hypothetical protein EG240_15980 [Paenimyroides tangerinum]
MVGLAKATKGSTQAIDYIMNDKGEAIELTRNYVMGENGQEVLAEFREVQRLNTRCENNTYTFVLSPDASQAKLSQEELLKLTQDHLKNLGLENHQYIAYVHNSTKSQHIHIIANRIGFDGKAHSDSNIHLKAHESADKLAKERGFHTAKEITQMKRAMTLDLRKEINQAYTQCKNQSVSMDDFERLMSEKGYDVKMSLNKQGKIQGFRINERQTGQSFKASEISSNVRLADLNKSIETNKKTIEEAKKILQSPKVANKLPTDLMKQIPKSLPMPLNVAMEVIKIAKTITKEISRGYGM